MKKLLTLMIALVVVLSLAACDVSTDDEIKKPSNVEVDGTGEQPHEHTEVVLSAVPATCTTDGLTEGKKCSVCNEILVAQEVIKASHAWNAGTVSTDPTCTEKGVKTFECDNCDATKTEDVKANGHSYATEWTVDLAPTCTNEGSKSHHCTVCGDKTDITVVDANGHKWNAGAVTTDPTCTEKGVKTFECDNCYATKTEDVKANGHNYSSVVTNKTCAANGKVTFTCPACDDTYEEIISPISISIAHVGTSSATMNGYGRFSLSYKITTSGGYGTVLCKMELFKTSSANSVSQMDYTDFSDSNYQVSYTGYEDTINEYYLVITAKDVAGNITVCKATLGNTTIVEQYVQDEHNYSDADDKCTRCGKIIDYTEGLSFEPINNGTEYSVAGIGTATDSDIIIPRTYEGKPVTAIGDSAFEKCEAIRSVRLHSEITSIGTKAFYFSSLSSVIFPNDGLKTIVSQAFTGCNLEGEIIIPNSVSSIDRSAFSWNDIVSFEFPKNINTISYHVLGVCSNLTTIIIPKSVNTIDSTAFSNCSNLTDIVFLGTKAEWGVINKKSDWDTYTGNYIIHCTDGDLTKAEA